MFQPSPSLFLYLTANCILNTANYGFAASGIASG